MTRNTKAKLLASADMILGALIITMFDGPIAAAIGIGIWAIGLIALLLACRLERPS